MVDKGWSINPKAWDALEQALLKWKAWNSVLLTKNDQSLVPERPGVYAICAQPPYATGKNRKTLFHSLATPLYIGRSESSIRSRFRVHCQTPTQQLRRAKQCYDRVNLSFWFIELPVSTVKDTEARLIKCFGPPVNNRDGTITGTIKPPIEV